MPRKPLNGIAMTAVERQRRHRRLALQAATALEAKVVQDPDAGCFSPATDRKTEEAATAPVPEKRASQTAPAADPLARDPEAVATWIIDAVSEERANQIAAALSRRLTARRTGTVDPSSAWWQLMQRR